MKNFQPTPVKAMYPGSFDPITNGHLDILDRALKIFSHVTLVVAGAGDRKSPLLTPDERVELIREVVRDRKNVSVDRWSGLIMDYAQNHGIGAVVRGLRAASDFEYEFMMASMNKRITADVETFFMMTSQNLFFVSSTMIKELYRYGGDIAPYVPEPVVRRLAEVAPRESKGSKKK